MRNLILSITLITLATAANAQMNNGNQFYSNGDGTYSSRNGYTGHFDNNGFTYQQNMPGTYIGPNPSTTCAPTSGTAINQGCTYSR